MNFSSALIFLTFLVSQIWALRGEASGEAFYIEPMVIQFRGKEPRPAVLKLINNDDRGVKIRIDIFERSEDINGVESRRLTKDIKIEQNEFLLPAGKTRELSVRYLSTRKLVSERSYRIVVKQIDAMSTPSLDLRFVYVASVYVAPENAKPKLVVESVRRRSDFSADVRIRNAGDAHLDFGNVTTILEQREGQILREFELSDSGRKKLSKQIVLAGGSRNITLETVEGPDRALSAAPSAGPLKLRFEIRNITLD